MNAQDQRRFDAKIDKSGDCWGWTASKNRKGYGTFGLNGKTQLAHRVALTWTHI